jgi:phosphoribosylformylglycinamidine cyclo-ligase
VIVAKQDAEAAQALLSAEGEQVWAIGHIRRQRANEAPTIVV